MKGWLAATFLAGALVDPASAGEAQTRFNVTVTVPVHVTLEVIEEPAALTVTDADIARGYKDVAARYRVRHNDRSGCLLRIAPTVGLTRWVEVRGLGADIVLRDDVVDIHLPGDAFLQSLELEFRFVLDASIQPGSYALPVNIAATPV